MYAALLQIAIDLYLKDTVIQTFILKLFDTIRQLHI